MESSYKEVNWKLICDASICACAGWGAVHRLHQAFQGASCAVGNWLSPHYLAPLICRISGTDSWKVYSNLGHPFLCKFSVFLSACHHHLLSKAGIL